MDTEWIIHIGAPRTGTSYLRKYVFPYLKNVTFINKQNCNNIHTSLVDYFSCLAHAGDGDEIAAEKLIEEFPGIDTTGKVLISEEHFLWSVYHMFGNVRGRAMLLKSTLPKAKIVLTIRRQPEYLISLYQYSQTLEKWHLGKQMSRIENMSGLNDEFVDARINTIFGIPCGVQLAKKYIQRKPGNNYFRRDERYFVYPEVSWIRIANVYREYFGRENVLILPQEILKNDLGQAIQILSKFCGTTVKLPPESYLAKENRSSKAYSPFTNGFEEEQFKKTILAINIEENECLASELPSLDLEKYGYLDKGEFSERVISIGSQGRASKQLSNSSLSLLSKIVTAKRYYRWSKLFQLFFERARARISRRFFAGTSKIYRVFVGMIDRMKGLDFEKTEELEEIGIHPENGYRYEGTKRFELVRILNMIDIEKDSVAIDFGSGKGRAVSCLSENTKIKKVYGIELSEQLASIAKQNLQKLNIINVDILSIDARDTPDEVLDESNLIYFYNPFPKDVMNSVVKNIEMSIDRVPRNLLIIYFNPLHNERFMGSAVFKLQKEIRNPISNAVFHVYETRGMS